MVIVDDGSDIACSWASQEILERKFNLFPNILSAKQIESMPLINKRLTKSLDINGKYRIQSRGSVYFIKGIWQFTMLIAFLLMNGTNPQWFIDHFIHLKEETINYLPLLHFAASFVGFYSWEVVSNRYGKLKWSVLVHHWFTVGIAVAILLGRYTPFGTWYAFTVVGMMFPKNFALGFRSHFSYKYPVLTRKLLTFSYYLFAGNLALCLIGQVCIAVNSLVFHYNESIHVGFIVVTGVLMCAWLYDDIVTLKALRAFSLQKYEDVDPNILNNDASIKEHMELEIAAKPTTTPNTPNVTISAMKPERQKTAPNRSNEP